MLFIDNKYTKWYFNIINTRKLRKPNNTEYYEKHHIIPKCLGGNNKKDNLVKLTLKEHFLCHLLLSKMTSGVDKHKMLFALHRMSTIKGKYKITGKIFEIYRRNYIEMLRGKTQSVESNKKRSLKLKDKSYEDLYGKEKSDELKELRSSNRKGGYGRQNMSKDNPNAKSIIINGIYYHTKREACKSLNITYYELCKITS